MTEERGDWIGTLRDELGARALVFDERKEQRVFVDVAAEEVPAATRILCGGLAARFQTASGIDTPSGFEILYHWALDADGVVISVRTLLAHDAPEIDSLAPLCPAAEWIEREIWELLGVQFLNHPDLRHLLLGDDWPEGKYPLRRDFEG